jgi:molybdopterin synthase catalytic subunit
MDSQPKKHKKKSMFVEGPVSPHFIGESVAKHASDHSIGAHQIFLGQVRADEQDGRKVVAIDYSAYQEMADLSYAAYREVLFGKYQLTCMHVYHSLGTVRIGEICLYVFVSSRHRMDATQACSELVEWIKRETPVWGKILFEDDVVEWKVNTPLES